jgi:hypothetical protein
MAPSDLDVWALLVSTVHTLQSVALGMREPLKCRCGEWHWWSPDGGAAEVNGHVFNPAAPIFVPETTCAAAAGWSSVGRRACNKEKKATTVGAADSIRSNRFAALFEEDSGSDGVVAGGVDTHTVSGDAGIGADAVVRNIVTKKQRKRMSTALEGYAGVPAEGMSGFRGGIGARARGDTDCRDALGLLAEAGAVLSDEDSSSALRGGEGKALVITKSYVEEEPTDEELMVENGCWMKLVQSKSSGFSFEARISRVGGESGSVFHWEPKGLLGATTTCKDVAGRGPAHVEEEDDSTTVDRRTGKGRVVDMSLARRTLVDKVDFDGATAKVVLEYCDHMGFSTDGMRSFDPGDLAAEAWFWKDPNWSGDAAGVAEDSEGSSDGNAVRYCSSR